MTRPRRYVLTCWLLLPVLAVPTTASGQTGGPTPINATQKSDVLTALESRLSETYTFPERAEAVATHLLSRSAAGAYDSMASAREFAEVLTTDLRKYTSDLHFAIRHDPEQYAAIGAMGLGPNPMRSRFAGDTDDDQDVVQDAQPETPSAGMAGFDALLTSFSRTNFSMPRAEVFEGNIGYLKLGIFPPIDLASATVDAAMDFLGHTDALILDLRSVAGGVGGFTPYLASYFFEQENKLLFSREFAWADRSEERRTVDVGGTRRPDVPVFILTSEMTGSAGENLAYTLQQHGRAQVVGESTRGAAHSSTIVQLTHGFVAQIPIARVVHPVSDSNWEGSGVIPDAEARASEALTVARIEALDLLASSTVDAEYRARLIELVDDLRDELREALAASSDERASAEADLAEYVGKYGIRSVFLDDGILKYQREGGPPIRIVRKDGDLFRFDLDENMRAAVSLPDLRFERDAAGTVRQLSLIRGDGSVEAVLERSE